MKDYTNRIKKLNRRKEVTHGDQVLRNQRYSEAKEMYLNKYSSPLMKLTQSQIHNPKFFGIVEGIVAKLVNNDPMGSFTPTDETFTSTVTEINEDFKHRFYEDSMPLKQIKAVTYQTLYGYVPARLDWEYLEGKVWVKSKKKYIKDTTKDNWKLTIIDPQNVYLNPAHDTAIPYCQGSWAIEDMRMAVDDMVDQNKLKGRIRWMNLDGLNQKIEDRDSAVNGEYKGVRTTDNIRNTQGQQVKKQDPTAGEVIISMMYEKDRWFGYVEEFDLVVMDIKNPYRTNELPIHVSYSTMDLDSVYGISDAEIVRDIISADNSLLSMYMDAVGYSAIPMLTTLPGQSMEGITIGIGRILPQDVPNGIQQFSIKDTFSNTIQTAHFLLNQGYSDATGVIDGSKPTDQSSALQKTAAGVRQSTNQLDDRIGKKLKIYTELFIKPIAEQAIKLTYEFADEHTIVIKDKKAIAQLLAKQQRLSEQQEQAPTADPQGVAINGKTKPQFRMDETNTYAFLTVTEETYLGSYRWEVDSTMNVMNNSEARNQNFNDFFAVATNPVVDQGLQAQGKVIDWVELLSRFADLKSIKNFDDLVKDAPQPPQPSPEQIKQIQDQATQQAQAQAKPQSSPQDKIIESLNYKDLPEDIKRQVEQQAGFTPSTMGSEANPQVAQAVSQDILAGNVNHQDPHAVQAAINYHTHRLNGQTGTTGGSQGAGLTQG